MKAIFLDRDGTIIKDKEYLKSTEEIELLKGVLDALQILQNLGFKLIVISNQSGIGRGLITKEQVEKTNNYLLDLLFCNGVNITEIYYCPHSPKDNCNCRKPCPKMVYEAINKYEINKAESYFIGDKLIDALTGLNAGIKAVLIDKDLKPVDHHENITVVASLLSFAENLLDGSYL